MEQGRQVDMVRCFDEGWTEGNEEGFEEGGNIGYNEGREAGRKVGLCEGREQGRIEGRRKALEAFDRFLGDEMGVWSFPYSEAPGFENGQSRYTTPVPH